MPKRPVLSGVGAFKAVEPEPAPSPAVLATTNPLAAAPARSRTTGPRAGKKAVLFWTPPGAKRQLDQMALDMESSLQALMTEAVNDLFKKYDKPPIA